MLATWYWIRGWNVTVRINVARPFSRNASNFLESSFFWIIFIHNHSIGICASRDYHRCIGATSHDSPVMHNILREVLSVQNEKRLDCSK